MRIDGTPWVIARIGEALIGMESSWVAEMTVVPHVAPLPLAPDYVRGVVNRRNLVLPVVDLRKWLGLPSIEQEHSALLELLAQRRKDHENWLAELSASVTERRPFRLATDPHACAFGRWYDRFQPPNPVLARYFRQFDEPHARIHGVAVTVGELVQRRQYEEAQRVVSAARARELTVLLRLFDGVPEVLAENSRETLLLHQDGERSCGLLVDAVDSVARMDPESLQPLPQFQGDAAVPLRHTCRAAGDARIVLALDLRVLGTALSGDVFRCAGVQAPGAAAATL